MSKQKGLREILESYIKHECAYCEGDLIGGSNPLDQALSDISKLLPSEEEIAKEMNNNWSIDLGKNREERFKKLAYAIHTLIKERLGLAR